MNTILTKSQVVLLLSDHYAEAVRFDGDDSDGPTVRLPRERWVDMGRPNRITLTVEPGDRLN